MARLDIDNLLHEFANDRINRSERVVLFRLVAHSSCRDNESPDSADTQFFFLKWKQALIAPGRNTLDGFYSCFGYVTRNEDLLSQLEEGGGDYIVSARVVRGLENLQR